MDNTHLQLERALRMMSLLDSTHEAMRASFMDRAQFVTLPKGHYVCMEGDQCSVLPIVISGRARVYKSSPEGREITLYRIDPGECCILTASCIIGDRAFPAYAVTETEVEAVVIPTADFQDWFGRYEAWRTYVFTMVLNRLAAVIEYVEEIAFRRLDERLAGYLVEQSTDNGTLKRTHEQIAADLGTSREAVSRALKDLEHEGLIQLSRGTIAVASPAGLSSRVGRG